MHYFVFKKYMLIVDNRENIAKKFSINQSVCFDSILSSLFICTF